MLSNLRIRRGILLLVIIFGIGTVLVIKPIHQDPNYHMFADNRSVLFIPNFWNVTSNIPLFITGILGMFFFIQKWMAGIHGDLHLNKFIFFLGVCLTGIGSSYYHLHPNSERLLWDRLPMTISFMSFFSIIIGEFICVRSGKSILLPLLMLGVISLLYWKMTENRGGDDLRFYALVQFLPLLLIPVILLLFKSNAVSSHLFWLILLAYLIAKLFEANDSAIFSSGYFISGHTIKHFVATFGPLLFLGHEIRRMNTKKLKL